MPLAEGLAEKVDFFSTQVKTLLEQKEKDKEDKEHLEKQCRKLERGKALLNRDYEETTFTIGQGRSLMTVGEKKRLEERVLSLTRENEKLRGQADKNDYLEQFKAEKRTVERLEQESQEMHRLLMEKEELVSQLKAGLRQSNHELRQACGKIEELQLKRAHMEAAGSRIIGEWKEALALEEGKKHYWRSRYLKVMSGLNNRAEDLVQLWEKAKLEVSCTNPCKPLPSSIVGLINYCGKAARTLKRKRD